MSRHIDIREQFIKPLFENTKGGREMLENPEPNAYYQGNLDEQSANYLAGYDYAVENVLTEFFQNLISYLDQLEESGFDDQRLKAFDKHFLEFIAKEGTNEPLDLDTIEDTQIRLVLTLIRTFWDYAECQRDEIGVSLIELMDDEERAECQDKCKAGYKNYLLRLETAKQNGLI